jgi:hypothetical protein
LAYPFGDSIMGKYKQKPWNAVAAAEKLIGNKDPRIESLVRAYLSGLNSNKSALQAHLKIETAREILRNDPRTKELFCSRPSAPRPLPSPEDDAKCIFAREVLGQSRSQATASVGKTKNAYSNIAKRSSEVVMTYREQKKALAEEFCRRLSERQDDIIDAYFSFLDDMRIKRKLKTLPLAKILLLWSISIKSSIIRSLWLLMLMLILKLEGILLLQ